MNRYQRQVILPELGEEGQRRLRNASVLLIGCGGLGCSVAASLVRAGIGKLVVVDGDVVQLHNLHRQMLFDEGDVGKPKAKTAANRLKMANQEVEIAFMDVFLTEENAPDLVSACDVVLDGTDNFVTKYLTNQMAVKCDKPMVYGAVNGFEGQVCVFNYKDGNGNHSGHMRDLFPEISASEPLGNCEISGVMGPVADVMGQLMALECIKVLTGLGEPLTDRMLTVDLLQYRFYTMRYKRRPEVEGLTGFDRSSLSWKEALQMQAEVTLYDVRTPAERLAFNAGGIHLDVSEASLRAIPGRPMPVFYCESGSRAAKTAALFSKLRPEADCAFIREAIALSKA